MKRTPKHLRGVAAALALTLAVGLTAGATGALADPAGASEPLAIASPAVSEAPSAPGEAILIFDDSAAAERIVSSAAGSDAMEAQIVADDLGGRTFVAVDYGSEAKAEALIGAAEALPGVTAQPNYVYKLLDEGSGEAIADDVDDASASADTSSGVPAEGAESPSDATGDASATLAADASASSAAEALSASEATAQDAPFTVEELAELEALASAEAQSSWRPDDKLLHHQTYLESFGTTGSASGSNVYEAWDLARAQDGRTSVSVAVLDSGADLDHEDLQVALNKELAFNVVEDTPSVTDTIGHGTGVSGVIGATANNGKGLAGVAMGSDPAAGTGDESLFSIVPVKIFPDDSDETEVSNILKGFDYLDGLIKEGKLTDLRVINMSIGFYGDSASDGSDSAMHQAVEHFTNDYGVLCVGAGGNGDGKATPNTTMMLPGDYDECLSVTALSPEGANAPWADYNESKDISALGEDVATTDVDNIYCLTSGSSFSAPIASGVAAMMFSVDDSLAPADVVQIMRETAAPLRDYATNDHRGLTGSAGLLDAGAAMARLVEPEVMRVYRLYNPNSHEHLFTADANERHLLAASGWQDEDLAWKAPAASADDPDDGSDASTLAADATVMRLFNSQTREHLYTNDQREVDVLTKAGWTLEGEAWGSASADGTPVYRMFNHGNPGIASHHYTTSVNEYVTLAYRGWQPEGTAWYGL